MYFTYEMEDSDMKINFTDEIFFSPTELKQFAHEILFSYVKLHVKSLSGNTDRFSCSTWLSPNSFCG